MSNPIRVLVVEDQVVVRQGLISILSFYNDLEVVGEASDGIEGVKLVEKLKPDVVLLDLEMPKLDGLKTIPMIVKISPKTRILVVTGFGDADKISQAVKLGAMGYLLKDFTNEKLIYAINEVYRGEPFIPSSMAFRVIHEMDDVSSDSQTLTKRELETLLFIARGLSNYEIAEELNVHERTIAKYTSNILSKLHLSNRTQAALYALRKGLIDLDDEEE